MWYANIKSKAYKRGVGGDEMSTYNLDIDEAVVLQAFGVRNGDNNIVDLVLTNKNIIQVTKGFFGGDKGIEKNALSKLKILNGKANVLVGKNKRGEKQLELYFADCERYYRFDSTITTNKWINAITKVHKDCVSNAGTTPKNSGNVLIDSFKGALGKIGINKEREGRTCKCFKCGNELRGAKGSLVKCEYCDNEMVIK